MSRWIKALVVLLLMSTLFAATGCSSGATTGPSGKKNGFVIGFVNGYIGNTWRAQFVQDAQQAAAGLKSQGIISNFIVQSTNADVATQINQLNGLINQGVDALMIDPVSAPSLGPVIARAQAKHILVVITNDPAAYPNTYAVVGDNYTWWKIQALWLAQQLHGQGNIVLLTGLPGNTADTLRNQAAKDVLSKYPNIHVLASVPGKWDPAVAQSGMSTLLSTYKNINGVLEQDVMAQGLIQAYAAAGRPLPIATGDYSFGFLREWAQKYPNFDSIGVPYAPGDVTDALYVTVGLLQGKKLKPSALQSNPLDPSLHNAILVEPPYVVTKDAEPQAPWMQGLSFTKAISLPDAVQMGQGKPDSASLDASLTQQQVDTFFQ